MIATLHPAIVHLPIGVLCIYTLSELLRVLRYFNKEAWFRTRLFLVVVGVLTAVPAVATGDALEDLYGYQQLREIQLHSTFAWISVVIYGVMALGYLVVWLQHSQKWTQGPQVRPTAICMWTSIVRVGLVLTSRWLAIALATAGAVALTVTGALGASVAHGSTADPLVSFIHALFF